MKTFNSIISLVKSYLLQTEKNKNENNQNNIN